ncbi:MAG: hypothetical protein J5689_00195 [Clostridia bacterium]|nr:hypothetical protein [Clostridia bacterium]
MDEQKKAKFVENFMLMQIKKKKEQNKPLNKAEKEFLSEISDWRNEWRELRNYISKYYRLTSRSEKLTAAKNEVVKDKRADRALSYITTVSVDALKSAIYASGKANTETYEKVLNSLITKDNRYTFFINPDFVKMQDVILKHGNVKQLLEAAKHPGTDVVALLSKAYEVADKNGDNLDKVKESISKTFEMRWNYEAEFIEMANFRGYWGVYPSTGSFFKSYKPSVEDQLAESIENYEQNRLDVLAKEKNYQ